MAIIEDPEFARDFPGQSWKGKRRSLGGFPPVLPWLCVYLVNLILPIRLAAMVTNGAGRVGMVLGIVFVFALGCWLCFVARAAVLAVATGGWVVAVLQFVPPFHMYVGVVGAGLAVKLGTMSGWRTDRVDSVLGGFVATLATGAILLAIAAIYGLAIRWLMGWRRVAIGPAGKAEARPR